MNNTELRNTHLLSVTESTLWCVDWFRGLLRGFLKGIRALMDILLEEGRAAAEESYVQYRKCLYEIWRARMPRNEEGPPPRNQITQKASGPVGRQNR
eukprot:2078166-Amphidinium_carterae.1